MIEMDVGIAQRFLVALLIGALVGVEREKSQGAGGHRPMAGLRTFILLAQLGSLAAWLSQHLGSALLFVVAFALVGLAAMTGHLIESRSRPDSPGLANEIAAVTVFLLGGAVMYDYAEIAVALGIATSALLAFKDPLHGMVARVATDDIYAVLKLLIASFIVLPLLPNHAVDPWGVLNPYVLWLLVVLISGLSLVGYVAVRLLGEARGTVLTGLAGGLVSSTAASLSFARQARSEPTPGAADALAAGILASWTVMFLRAVVAVALVNRELVPMLVRAFWMMALAAAVMSAIFYLRGSRRAGYGGPGETMEVRNPFSLGSAMQFALLFALVLVLVKLAQNYAPASGIYVVAGLAGLTEMDAISLSIAQSSDKGLDFLTATRALGIAAMSNTLVKCGIVLALGSAPLRRRVGVATAVLFASAALAAVLST